MQNRALQRQVAMELFPSPDLGSSAPARSLFVSRPSLPSPKELKLPVLEPTVFYLHDFNAREWVNVVRSKNVRLKEANRITGQERRRSSQKALRRPPCGTRSGSECFQNFGPVRKKAFSGMHGPFFFQKVPLITPKVLRPAHVNRGLPEPIPRSSHLVLSYSRPKVARVLSGMAGSDPLPPRGGPPSSNPSLPGR
jgi:hypothetical protein